MIIYCRQNISNILRNNDNAKNKLWLIFHKIFVLTWKYLMAMLCLPPLSSSENKKKVEWNDKVEWKMEYGKELLKKYFRSGLIFYKN